MTIFRPARGATGPSYATFWRWHFYAGLFVLPFVLVLSVTGAVYLFKPQIDRWEERAFLHLGSVGAVSPDAQLAAARGASAGLPFAGYRLPRAPGDAAMIAFALPDGDQRQVFVSPRGEVLGQLNRDARISEFVARIHGSLLLGEWGDRLVELAASWTIVMILTGLVMWWPRPFRAAGTLWPRLRLRGRPLLKDLHRVAGFWIAGLVLMMLASGLPWAGSWGSAFQWARDELGLVQGPPSWKVGAVADHAGHQGHLHESSAAAALPPAPAGLSLAAIVARAEAEAMDFPVMVIPPRSPQSFGAPTGAEWTVKSETQNRPLARQVTYDPVTGAETGRRGFADKHVIDRVVGTGIAWHEGQLFGLANQLLGLATAIALIAVSCAGVWMWLKRRPLGTLGAPPRSAGRVPAWTIAVLLALALLQPLFGLSLLAILVVEAIAATVRSRQSAP